VKALFWLCALLIAFAYAGYPVWLYFRARFWPRPVRRANIFPMVTILLAARNEEENLVRKLQNIDRLDYPVNQFEVLVVSDGSTDGTNRILAAWESAGHRAVILPEHRGKASALNSGLAEARGEIVVFTDARQILAPDSLKNLVANFADPSVGCVSGELVLGEDSNAASLKGIGLYWRLEKKMRQWEALAGSSVGVTGAFYAARRSLIADLPAETVLDDVYIPLQVIRQNFRVVFETRAIVHDDLAPSVKQEFRRKVRTLTGNYQLLRLAPWVLTNANPLRFEFICHKVLRLLVPFALVGVLVSALWLRRGIYELVLILQVFFYALAGLGVFQPKAGIMARLSQMSLAFVVLNGAAAVAFLYFITGRKAMWAR
jgi:cellulose synthase/poly-beta-1,6-N-acetylglucosamine synthase-like glycosyltransferase